MNFNFIKYNSILCHSPPPTHTLPTKNLKCSIPWNSAMESPNGFILDSETLTKKSLPDWISSELSVHYVTHPTILGLCICVCLCLYVSVCVCMCVLISTDVNVWNLKSTIFKQYMFPIYHIPCVIREYSFTKELFLLLFSCALNLYSDLLFNRLIWNDRFKILFTHFSCLRMVFKFLQFFVKTLMSFILS